MYIQLIDFFLLILDVCVLFSSQERIFISIFRIILFSWPNLNMNTGR